MSDKTSKPQLVKRYAVLERVWADRYAHTPVYTNRGTILYATIEEAIRAGEVAVNMVRGIYREVSDFSEVEGMIHSQRVQEYADTRTYMHTPTSQLAVYEVIAPAKSLDQRHPSEPLRLGAMRTTRVDAVFDVTLDARARVMRRVSSLEEDTLPLNELEEAYKRDQKRIAKIKAQTEEE